MKVKTQHMRMRERYVGRGEEKGNGMKDFFGEGGMIERLTIDETRFDFPLVSNPDLLTPPPPPSHEPKTHTRRKKEIRVSSPFPLLPPLLLLFRRGAVSHSNLCCHFFSFFLAFISPPPRVLSFNSFFGRLVREGDEGVWPPARKRLHVRRKVVSPFSSRASKEDHHHTIIHAVIFVFFSLHPYHPFLGLVFWGGVCLG